MRNVGWVVSFVVVVGCGTSKAPPTDDPMVDDDKADSLYAPTMQGAFGAGGEQAASFTSTVKYLGYTMTLDAGEQVTIWTGGADAASGDLDTVAYLYAPKNSTGHRGRYLVRNDDWTGNSYSSHFAYTAQVAGDYLLVVTTYHKPEPGTLWITSDLEGGPAPVPPQGQPVGPFAVDLRSFPDPELLAAASVTDTLSLLARDKADGDPLTIASDIEALWGGRKWPLDIKDQVDQAVHHALPRATTFVHWPDRAQSILLTDPYMFQPATATETTAMHQLALELAASWPGSTIFNESVAAQTYNSKTFGYELDVVLRSADGVQQFTSRQFFASDGHYLGDASWGADFDNQD